MEMHFPTPTFCPIFPILQALQDRDYYLSDSTLPYTGGPEKKSKWIQTILH